ncbi:Mycothiol maleylpyruvate isomerase N-terminal domain protein [Mycobacteroides abscessus subsp. abscessus]|uniref:maleylpyruvate isomerase N-terminal domain-containing protein n=1 Tax=Mycobacteroides abscessus TaxID=36809 RepID=UPI00092B15A5|nr:maleylpyruvate isomerase N-terminal domain-containing protein [Mycobacteroides abscessus]SHU34603.1 Mycothiol maleylpyruvate isomerase N-terminal domain protein [Mycobacteroides abscessus subsp. abscessus]SHX94260.1 Mycothiol maleylpyruvate isomerase N-terminal domain protein [Mycobacteroides abscessus subsp. abscessus]SIH27249.1 Mycothiol maleylpyruvate isomerase N-terminal domain protein [Mycobacteroides abscessus subsp. abscessus]SKD20433.1 Mycothiol maleylpyruvate isomerase N-terminal do
MNLFTHSWAALRAAVADLPIQAFAQPSGCAGWLVRDLVCHLIIDAQDVLITLATPSDQAPTHDEVTYWKLLDSPPTGRDPLDALIVRLAAAYRDPSLLSFHLDDVGAAAGRAAALADGKQPIATKGQVLTTADYLDAYVLEWTLHHLDLIAHLPELATPPTEGLGYARGLMERIGGFEFPAQIPDTDALLVGTGRRAASAYEAEALGPLHERLPLLLA